MQQDEVFKNGREEPRKEYHKSTKKRREGKK